MWYVYRITNIKRNHHYTGITENPKLRLKLHNKGLTKSTKSYRPFDKIIILKHCLSRTEARKWEKYYKSGIGREKITIGA